MAQTLTLAMIEPLLAQPLSEGQKPRAEAWLAAIDTVLSVRYGVKLAEMTSYFSVFAADAVQRRLDKKNQLADSEGAGPFTVRWNAASTRGGWFLAGELAEMDDAAGLGGVRTYRTPAPDGVIHGNLVDSAGIDGDIDAYLTDIAEEAL